MAWALYQWQGNAPVGRSLLTAATGPPEAADGGRRAWPLRFSRPTRRRACSRRVTRGADRRPRGRALSVIAFGNGDAAQAGRLRRRDPVGRIFDGERAGRIDTEPRARFEIGVGRGLRPQRAAGGHDVAKRWRASSRSRWSTTQSDGELDAIATPSPAASASSIHASTPARTFSRPSSSSRCARRASCIASMSTGPVARSISHASRSISPAVPISADHSSIVGGRRRAPRTPRTTTRRRGPRCRG